MNNHLHGSCLLAAAVIAFAGLLGTGMATAADTAAAAAQARFEKDHAKCMSGASNQDRPICLKEAGAALEETRNRSLGASSGGELAENRLKRCETLPATEREECAARMNEGATTGSAQQGGVLREVTTPAN